MKTCSKSKTQVVFSMFSGTIGLFIVFILMLVSGCATQEGSTKSDSNIRPTSMTVVSSFRSQVRMPPGSRFAWNSLSIHAKDSNQDKKQSLQNMIESAMVKTLTEMGYQYSESMEQSDFLVGYQLVLGDKGRAEEISNQYGVQPGLVASSQTASNYQEGTLVVDIAQAQSKVAIWTGAIQSFINVNNPQTVMQQRVDMSIARLLRGFSAN